MPKEPIPRGLDYLYDKYMRHERIEWGDTTPGTEIVIEALDRKTGDDGFFGLTVLGVNEAKNGIKTATMQVGETEMWVTEDTDERDIVHLPAGTILESGISARFFPTTDITMAYFGGISVNRDYSLGYALLPDGRIIDGVLIPQVKTLISFLPEEGFTPPQLDAYNDAIRAHKEESLSEDEKYIAELDRTILERATELFPDEVAHVREEILAQFATFNPEGRYTLLCLMEHANDQGALDNFNTALKAAIEKEFVYLHPQVRGAGMFPATQRGWSMLIRDLGLVFE